MNVSYITQLLFRNYTRLFEAPSPYYDQLGYISMMYSVHVGANHTTLYYTFPWIFTPLLCNDSNHY